MIRITSQLSTMADFDYGFASLQTPPATAPNGIASRSASASGANDEGWQTAKDGNDNMKGDNGEKRGGPSAR